MQHMSLSPLVGKYFVFTSPTHILSTSYFTGHILMTLKLPAERLTATKLLASTIIDYENISTDLIPYIALESHTNREAILKCITNIHK